MPKPFLVKMNGMRVEDNSSEDVVPCLATAQKQETRRKCLTGTAGRVPFVPDVRRGGKRDGRLLVFMPHGLQQFFAFVLSDFATAFFSQIAHD